MSTLGMVPLPVHERFMSWQGEGVHAGRAAFFIRLYGCPVHCPWCDSAGTWHPAFAPIDLAYRPPDDLAWEAAGSGAPFVVITGGEPAIHDLTALTGALRAHGLPCHLETSGGFPIRGTFDWITVSPKWRKLPLKENLEQAHEWKLIIEDENSVDRWIEYLGDKPAVAHVWLHPEWSQRDNPAVLNAINRAVKQRGDPFRAGYQLHKCFAVDEEDDRSRTAVPLGGVPDAQQHAR